jgi:hypothetical protein
MSKSFQLTWYSKINDFIFSHPDDYDDEDPVEPDLGGWVCEVNESGGLIYGWVVQDSVRRIRSFYMNETHDFVDAVSFAEWANSTELAIQSATESGEQERYSELYSEFEELASNEMGAVYISLQERGVGEFGLLLADVEAVLAEICRDL